MAAFEDAVRPYQLPGNSPAQLYLPQYNLASQGPVMITPGFGSGNIQAFPLQTGSAQHSRTITFYLDQAANEQVAQEV